MPSFTLRPASRRPQARIASTLCLIALGWIAAPAAAQTAQLSDPGQMSGLETVVDFEGLSVQLQLTDQLSALGVEFLLGSGEGAFVADLPGPRQFGPLGDNEIRNFDVDLAGRGELALSFALPVNRVAFEMRNDPLDDLVLTLASSADGLPVAPPLTIATGGAYLWVGVESGAAFDRVVIDLAGTGNGTFAIDNLRFEPLAVCSGTLFADGFETGALEPGWDVLGASGVVSQAFGTPPSSGVWQALAATEAVPGSTGVAGDAASVEAFLGLAPGTLAGVTSEGGPPQDGAALRRTFTVAAGDTLTFQWSFLTTESTPDSVWNDFAFFTVGDGSATLLADTSFSPFPVSNVDLEPGEPSSITKETGYQTFTHVFAADGTYTLGFGVINAQDPGPGFPSALLVDCVAIDGVPVVNQPPTCSADLTEALLDFEYPPGSGLLVVTEGEGLVVPFTGVDPDGDDLVASGDLPAGAGLSPTDGSSPLTSVLAWTPVAADKGGAPYTLAVTFTDPDDAFATCEVGVADINLRPVCSIQGAPTLVVSATGPDGALVTLQGSATDEDDTELEYQWFVGSSVVLDDESSPTPTGLFPVGSTTATLCVTDGRGGVSDCVVEVVVQDLVPPEISCWVWPRKLWPPKHDMRQVALVIFVDEACATPGAVQVVEVTVSSDEPDDAVGAGDGHTTGDVDGMDGFTAPVDVTTWVIPHPCLPNAWLATFLLRAERAGGGDGRTYTIDVTAVDSQGAVAETSCVVIVPHSKKKGGGS